MELREWAVCILSATSLEDKLFVPETLTDHSPGLPLRFDTPSRPAHMQFQRHAREHKLPPFQEHHSADKRAVCLHRFAGHELLAVEVMAQALLAFPDASKAFRKGVAHTLKEEQGHVRLYMNRMKELGLTFGDLPLYRHFWAYVPHLHDPIQYVSVMSLTLEMANLDFAPMYCKSFANAQDTASANLMKTILEDEIRHVSFGLSWLNKWKEQTLSSLEAWKLALPEAVKPLRAKGFVVHEEPRKKAGIPQDWINHLKTL